MKRVPRDPRPGKGDARRLAEATSGSKITAASGKPISTAFFPQSAVLNSCATNARIASRPLRSARFLPLVDVSFCKVGVENNGLT